MPSPRNPPTHRLRDRPTADLVVIFLAGVVGIAVTLELIGAFVWAILQPDVDLNLLLRRIAYIINTIVGGVIGYIAGRGVDSTRRDP